jgi:ribonuclease Z
LFKFEVTILGCSSATPVFNRHPTSQWVNYNNTHFLLDCGEGTQMQITRFGLKASKLSHIFISHLHGDHYLGLMGLISSMNLNGRTADLHIYAPSQLEALMHSHFEISQSHIRFPLFFHNTFPEPKDPEPTHFNSEILLDFPINLKDGPQVEIHSRVLLETKEFSVSTIPLKHSIPCCGFLIKELGVTRNQEGNPRSYAFCSDTRYTPQLQELLFGVATLYHETTFSHSMVNRAEVTYHSTASQAAQLAKDCCAGKLLMGHFSARYKDLNPLLEEAKSIFPDSYLAVEGITFSI